MELGFSFLLISVRPSLSVLIFAGRILSFEVTLVLPLFTLKTSYFSSVVKAPVRKRYICVKLTGPILISWMLSIIS